MPRTWRSNPLKLPTPEQGPAGGCFVRWKWAPPAVELVVDALMSLGRQADGRDALDGQHAERGHHHRPAGPRSDRELGLLRVCLQADFERETWG